jgi:hypothetical protein
LRLILAKTLDARRSTLDVWRALVPHSLSLLLLTAAFLKGYELYAAPLPEASVWTSRTLRIAAVEGEVFMGLWLLSGLWRCGARWAALAAFHVFFTMSLSLALAGEESCGCFGRVPIDPRWTAALDFAAILALWRWSPAEQGGWPVGGRNLRLGAILLLFLLVSVPGGIVLAGRWPEIEADGTVIVLKPEKWVGRRCPLLPYADIGDELSQGRWLVVLYRHDCPHCREVVSHYEAKARAAAADPAAPRIAFLAVPPHGAPLWKFAPSSGCRQGRLTASKEWFGATPAVLHLQDGVVQAESAQP